MTVGCASFAASLCMAYEVLQPLPVVLLPLTSSTLLLLYNCVLVWQGGKSLLTFQHCLSIRPVCPLSSMCGEPRILVDSAAVGSCI